MTDFNEVCVISNEIDEHLEEVEKFENGMEEDEEEDYQPYHDPDCIADQMLEDENSYDYPW